MPIFIDQIMNKKTITVHGDGKQTRSMGHASDLANGTYLVMQNMEVCAGEIINIGNDEEVSVLDSVYMIAEELCVDKNNLSIDFILNPSSCLNWLRANNTKFPESASISMSMTFSNGNLFLWNDVSDPSTIWTEESDPTSIWTEESDPTSTWTKIDYPN